MNSSEVEALITAAVAVSEEKKDGELQKMLSVVMVMLLSVEMFANQAGFALLEAGSVRVRHEKAVLSKNLLDLSFGVVSWYLVGFAIYNAFDPEGVSGARTAATNDDALFPELFKLAGFALTLNTILSGSVVGRMKLSVFLVMVVLQSALLFPALAGLSWLGWLAEQGFKDFAGAMVVHGTGGMMGLLGAYMVGPRYDRFVQEKHKSGIFQGERFHMGVRDIEGSNATSRVLGTLMLWLSWFSFNAVSATVPGTPIDVVISLAMRSMLNTLVAGCAACAAGTATVHYMDHFYNIDDMCGSLLAGLVAITAGCAYVSVPSALCIGAVSALVYLGAKWFVLYKLRIDDPLGCFALHSAAGFWGCIAVGLFDSEAGTFTTGQLHLLWVQLYGSVLLFAMTVAPGIVALKVMDMTVGLTIDPVHQELGLDMHYHDGYDVADDLGPMQVLGEANRRRAVLAELNRRQRLNGGASHTPTATSALSAAIASAPSAAATQPPDNTKVVPT